MQDNLVFENPLVEFADVEEQGEGHWVDNKFYPSTEWDMKVILTSVVKSFPDGTLIKPVHNNYIYHKLEGLWYCSKLDRPDLAWKQIYIKDQYMRINPNLYTIYYEPGITE